MRGITIGSLKTVPPNAFLIVPLGDNHTVPPISVDPYDIFRKESKEGHTLLQIKLLNSRLIRRNSRTLNAHRVLLNRLRAINRNPIIRLIPILQSQIIVLEIDIQIRVDEFILNILPDDPRHLVAVELHYGVLDLDLLEGCHVARVDECGT